MSRSQHTWHSCVYVKFTNPVSNTIRQAEITRWCIQFIIQMLIWRKERRFKHSKEWKGKWNGMTTFQTNFNFKATWKTVRVNKWIGWKKKTISLKFASSAKIGIRDYSNYISYHTKRNTSWGLMLRWNHLFEVLSIRKKRKKATLLLHDIQKKKLKDGDEEKQRFKSNIDIHSSNSPIRVLSPFNEQTQCHYSSFITYLII